MRLIILTAALLICDALNPGWYVELRAIQRHVIVASLVGLAVVLDGWEMWKRWKR